MGPFAFYEETARTRDRDGLKLGPNSDPKHTKTRKAYGTPRKSLKAEPLQTPRTEYFSIPNEDKMSRKRTFEPSPNVSKSNQSSPDCYNRELIDYEGTEISKTAIWSAMSDHSKQPTKVPKLNTGKDSNFDSLSTNQRARSDSQNMKEEENQNSPSPNAKIIQCSPIPVPNTNRSEGLESPLIPKRLALADKDLKDLISSPILTPPSPEFAQTKSDIFYLTADSHTLINPSSKPKNASISLLKTQGRIRENTETPGTKVIREIEAEGWTSSEFPTNPSYNLDKENNSSWQQNSKPENEAKEETSDEKKKCLQNYIIDKSKVIPENISKIPEESNFNHEQNAPFSQILESKRNQTNLTDSNELNKTSEQKSFKAQGRLEFDDDMALKRTQKMGLRRKGDEKVGRDLSQILFFIMIQILLALLILGFIFFQPNVCGTKYAYVPEVQGFFVPEDGGNARLSFPLDSLWSPTGLSIPDSKERYPLNKWTLPSWTRESQSVREWTTSFFDDSSFFHSLINKSQISGSMNSFPYHLNLWKTRYLRQQPIWSFFGG